MSHELPNLIDERRFKRRDEPERPQVERDELGRVCPMNTMVLNEVLNCESLAQMA